MAKKIVYEIPIGTRLSYCHSCNAAIFWVKTKAGKNMPLDEDGQPHWGSCPNAKDFKRS